MHLLVLSAFRPIGGVDGRLDDTPSQCTFWCSVLSDRFSGRLIRRAVAWSLNAPFGAQCFPTGGSRRLSTESPSVSMHLLVLSAFRRPAVRAQHDSP